MDRDQEFPRFDPMVHRLLDNAPSYDIRARLEDGLCICETTKMSSANNSLLLHSKWQEEGSLTRLKREECKALSRAGYRVRKDDDGYWVWWREKHLSHLWLTVGDGGWMTTSSPHLNGAKWNLIGSFIDPIVPYFEGYEITLQDILREGLTSAVTLLREYTPDKVFSAEFFAVAKELCDEALANLEITPEWVNDIIFKGLIKR